MYQYGYALLLALMLLTGGPALRHDTHASVATESSTHLWKQGYDACVLRDDLGCYVEPHSAFLAHETLDTRSTLLRVEHQVNQTMRYESDPRQYKMDEYWISGQKRGDCEDYALTMRAKLLMLGFPGNALRMAVFVQPDPSMPADAALLVYTDENPTDPYVLRYRQKDVPRFSEWPLRGTYYLVAVQNGEKQWLLARQDGTLAPMQ